MRTMMKARLDVNASNARLLDGSMRQSIQEMVEQLQPEACYFYTENGKRTFFMVFDMKDSSQVAQFAEPLFLQFGAEIEYFPVMNHADLTKGIESFMKQSRKAA